MRTETPVESEFFGHVRGAYTGAVRDRSGRFQTADGGTSSSTRSAADLVSTSAPDVVFTDREWRDRERQNLMKALERTTGRIYGKDGAATLLGINPTTLASRLRALEIATPKPR